MNLKQRAGRLIVRSTGTHIRRTLPHTRFVVEPGAVPREGAMLESIALRTLDRYTLRVH